MKYDKNYVLNLCKSFEFEIIGEYTKQKLSFYVKDKNEYILKTTVKDLNKGSYPNIVHPNNKYSTSNLKHWCELNNKTFILISEEYINNNTNLLWHCNICNEDFEATWANISKDRGCPFCSGKKVSTNNCLATKNPKIANEWDYDKNGTLTPFNVTENSAKKVWWICPNNSKHSWFASIAKRSYCGCPYCSGHKVDPEHNFGTENLNILDEWDYSKNEKTPFDYSVSSGKKVWWMCRDCKHSWKASIAKRTGNGTSCPKCNKSKGELKIHNFLEEIHKYFISQKEFDNLLGVFGNNLSYDFYLPEENLLIEYQGEFHDGSAKMQTKNDYEKQKEHDRRKRDYAKEHGIRLLEIWYYDFDNIESILSQKL